MAKQELLATTRDRYRASSRKDKSRILDEFIAVTGHHREHGIRLLSQCEDVRRLLADSAATLDRLLKPVRATVAGRSKRRRRLSPGRNIPVRTFADWNKPPPGFLEIDLGVCLRISFRDE